MPLEGAEHRAVPGAGRMIREQECRVPERSLTFTNHRVWQGGKDRSRLAGGLSCAAGTAQQVLPCCQPGHTGCPQPSSHKAGHGAGDAVRPPALTGTWHWEGSADRRWRQEMKPVLMPHCSLKMHPCWSTLEGPVATHSPS